MIFQGKTVEDAIGAGLKELGLRQEDAEIVVLEQGKRGILGIGAVPAKVEVKAKAAPAPAAATAESAPMSAPKAAPKAAPAAERDAAPAPAKAERDPSAPSDGERAVKFLEGLFPLLGSEAKPVLTSEDEKIVIQLDGDKSCIGRRGEIIDAVQTLAGAVANTGRREYKRVVVDCGNYREEREETLRRVARKMAAKAVRLGKRVRLEPMNPYERRIIHSALVDNEDVTTKSEGREPARYVVIIPKNVRTDKRGGRGDRDRKYGGRGGRGDKRDDRKYGEKRERAPYPKRDLPSEATPESSGTSFSRGGTPGYKKGGFSGFFGTYLGKAEDEPATPETSAETEPAVPEKTAPSDEE